MLGSMHQNERWFVLFGIFVPQVHISELLDADSNSQRTCAQLTYGLHIEWRGSNHDGAGNGRTDTDDLAALVAAAWFEESVMPGRMVVASLETSSRAHPRRGSHHMRKNLNMFSSTPHP